MHNMHDMRVNFCTRPKYMISILSEVIREKKLPISILESISLYLNIQTTPDYDSIVSVVTHYNIGNYKCLRLNVTMA